MKYRSAVFCEHANEAPTGSSGPIYCQCPPDCACREHMCKPERGQPGPRDQQLKPWQQACLILYEESNLGISRFMLPNGGVVIVVRDEFDNCEPKHIRDCILAWYQEHNATNNTVTVHPKDHGEA